MCGISIPTLARAILVGKGCLELRLTGSIVVCNCGDRRLPEFSVLQRSSLRFCGDFSKLKQNIACKILFEEERQALKQSGEKREPLAKFALPRRDGLFCHTIFSILQYKTN